MNLQHVIKISSTCGNCHAILPITSQHRNVLQLPDLTLVLDSRTQGRLQYRDERGRFRSCPVRI